MKQAWQQLAADMEQQQQDLQRQLRPDSPQQPGSTAPLHLAHCATLSGFAAAAGALRDGQGW